MILEVFTILDLQIHELWPTNYSAKMLLGHNVNSIETSIEHYNSLVSDKKLIPSSIKIFIQVSVVDPEMKIPTIQENMSFLLINQTPLFVKISITI